MRWVTSLRFCDRFTVPRGLAILALSSANLKHLEIPAGMLQRMSALAFTKLRSVVLDAVPGVLDPFDATVEVLFPDVTSLRLDYAYNLDILEGILKMFPGLESVDFLVDDDTFRSGCRNSVTQK
jgi:hypothetical protein